MTYRAWHLDDDLTEEEKSLLGEDVKAVVDQYFERSSPLTIDVTRSGKGYSVCLLFGAGRIKNCKRPLNN